MGGAGIARIIKAAAATSPAKIVSTP